MNRYADWIEQARAERRAAGALAQLGHHAWCCFTSQQAAEKALKAALERQGRPRFGHNLNDLLSNVAGSAPAPAALREAAARLNRHYIPTRYPDAFPAGIPADQYTAADAEQALNDADLVLEFVDQAV